MPFSVDLDEIKDLFYDGVTDSKKEYNSMLKLLEKSNTLKTLEKVFNIDSINRSKFVKFAVSIGTDLKTASEIFSCCTESFPTNEADNDGPIDSLPDCYMTPSQFCNGFIRLANFTHLVEFGFENSGNLCNQVDALLIKVHAL